MVPAVTSVARRREGTPALTLDCNTGIHMGSFANLRKRPDIPAMPDLLSPLFARGSLSTPVLQTRAKHDIEGSRGIRITES